MNVLAWIDQPTLLVDLSKVDRNVERMVERSKKFGYELMPHFKTHQSRSIGELYRNKGVRRITVSSLKMAEYFAGQPWDHVHIAFPPTFRWKQRLKKLAEQQHLSINVSSPAHIEAIAGIENITAFIDIDTGYGRTGVFVTDHHTIEQLVGGLEDLKISFGGFYSHNGSTYNQNSRQAILEKHDSAVTALRNLKRHFPVVSPSIVFGDTPGCSVANEFDGIDLVSAGNSIFFDLYQSELGTCRLDDIAVCMACPVVEKKSSGYQLVIHGGAVHFSKEQMIREGQPCFGKAVSLKKDGWSITASEGWLSNISQEHGVVTVSKETYHSLSEGDLIGILPVHSCLTADCMGEYLSFDQRTFNMMKR